MDVMIKKLALIAILATTLALPATGALARGGWGGGGHGGGGFGGGHMGGGFGGGHMGGGHFGGAHMGGGFARSHVGGFHGGHFAHRGFFNNGLGYYDDSCWDWRSTPDGWVCVGPY
jgi:hypothetical protein